MELKTLDASDCVSLTHIPNSIGDLASLSRLDLTGCEELAQLPDSIGFLVSLLQLLLSRCYLLRQIPDSIGKSSRFSMPLILHLESTAIEELPESIGSLKELKTLDASYCASLAHIPNSIGDLASLSRLDLTGCEKLAQLPNSIGFLVSLARLLLLKCHSLRQIPDSIGKLTSLIELHLESTAIEELPESIGSLKELKTLDASYCASLACIPNSIGDLASLSRLDLTGCEKLAQLPDSIGFLISLPQLLLSKCHSLRQIPDSIGKLTSLTELHLNSTAIEELPESIGSLKVLKFLDVSYCASLAHIPNSIINLASLSCLDLTGCEKLAQLLDSMVGMVSGIIVALADKMKQVSRLIYTNSGQAILALSSNAVHKLWKWQKSDRNLSGKATTSVVPQLWQPPSGILMTNDISDTNPEDAVPCFALSKNDSYVMSASGGKISLFNMMTFKTMTTFMPPPPAATFLAFHPQDNNIIAIGMEDSSIQIYNVRVDEVKTKLKGHQKRITGLAFSNVLNVLVSSGADSQLCVWSTDGWEKQASKVLQMPTGRGAAPLAYTRVQFHLDQILLLVVHETQIAIYEAPKLDCRRQWVTQEASGPITYATFSCDGQSIYVSFEDGSIGILTASALRFRCRINPAAYILPNPSLRVYPLVIAAHPSEPNQFAIGLTDGSVYVLDPSESEGKWGTSPPVLKWCWA
ncbi:hypothetical protein BT93_C0727 [Corymbia citriodora subsp. variegata]|nr:hypothetical protein BT93_C0727 [Corymbia citriodora subsp. variegata]